jgi:glycosyltransferase involved in cell wall biosynthesis
MSLLKQKILITNPQNTTVFFQSQVDIIKYEFTKQHQRILRIHDMFPITNPEWFTKKSIFSFKKGISNIEDYSVIFANSLSTSYSFQNIVNCAEKNLSIFVVPCSTEINKSVFCNTCLFCINPNQFRLPYLLSVGTIEPRKNHKNLLKAWKNSKKRREYKKLVIVGREGWKSKEIIKDIKRTEDVVLITDSCDAGLVELYKHSAAFITTSLNEGYNITLDEASNQRCNLIISDIAVHRERFQEKDGIWFNPESVESITMAIIEDLQISRTPNLGKINFAENFASAFKRAFDVA